MTTATIWTLLTRELAERLLADRHPNRILKWPAIRTMARDMKAGRWRGDNGATLAVCPDGRLVDGQNRCMAVIQSGCDVWVNIMHGVSPDPETFNTIDNGSKRTVSDNLHRAGVPNSTSVSATARAAMSCIGDHGPPGTSLTNPRWDRIHRGPPLPARGGGQHVSGEKPVFRPLGLNAVLFLANASRRRVGPVGGTVYRRRGDGRAGLTVMTRA